MRQKQFTHGQSLVEFALIIPMVLFLLLGFFDLGRAFFYQSTLSNAVREGTRSGIVMEFDENALKTIVLDSAFGLTNSNPPLTADDILITVQHDGDGLQDTLQIMVNYCFVPVTPGIALLLGQNCTNGGQGVDLTAESVMHFEPAFK